MKSLGTNLIYRSPVFLTLNSKGSTQVVMGVGFLEVHSIEPVVVLEHLSSVGLGELCGIGFKAVVVKVFYNIVDCLQFLADFGAVSSLQVDILDEGLEEGLPEFGEGVQEVWRLHVVVVQQLHLALDGGDGLVNFLVLRLHRPIFNYYNTFGITNSSTLTIFYYRNLWV